MPVAPSQKDSPIVHYRRQCNGRLSPSIVTTAAGRYGTDLVSSLEHLTAIATNTETDTNLGHVFSTRSPPILNLSPNLSPSDPQRTSPFYDLRESTRRRALQEQSPQIFSDFLDEADSKSSESPTRKRRKTSNSILEHPAQHSPPVEYIPWPVEPVQPAVVSHEPIVRSTRSQRSSASRRISGNTERTERTTAMTSRARRSPGTRRRTPRHRHDPEIYEDRHSFQPGMTSLPQPSMLLGQTQQTPMLVDMEQVHGSLPMSITPYAMPLCTTAIHPLCQGHYPAWTVPTCRLPIGHLPTCTLQHLPLPPLHPATTLPHYHPAQTMPIPYSNHMHGVAPPPHHPPLHFLPPQPPPTAAQISQHTNGANRDDIRLSGDQRLHYPLPPRLPRALNTSTPFILHEHATVHHPLPHELYVNHPTHETFPQGLYYSSAPPPQTLRGAPHLHTLPPPTPPYPGFLLQFLAMLGRPAALPPYRINLNTNYTEVENYEALLHLAERLGEAKPRGLSKHDIEQLPAYRFNAETHKSHSDQTSCVVCMCDFENRQLLRVLPCNHEFHAKCVDRWLKTNRTCPICRADTMDMGNQSE